MKIELKTSSNAKAVLRVFANNISIWTWILIATCRTETRPSVYARWGLELRMLQGRQEKYMLF